MVSSSAPSLVSRKSPSNCIPFAPSPKLAPLLLSGSNGTTPGLLISHSAIGTRVSSTSYHPNTRLDTKGTLQASTTCRPFGLWHNSAVFAWFCAAATLADFVSLPSRSGRGSSTLTLERFSGDRPTLQGNKFSLPFAARKHHGLSSC